VRLIEPAGAHSGADLSAVPQRFEPRAGAWLLVPLHHIFGSEELSAIAPGVRELTPEPYVALNSDDADMLGLAAGDLACVHVGPAPCRLPVQRRADLRRGVAGLPMLAGLHAITLPAFAKITKAELS
jgi:NADH-quinone oxidoreductase subunit G